MRKAQEQLLNPSKKATNGWTEVRCWRHLDQGSKKSIGDSERQILAQWQVWFQSDTSLNVQTCRGLLAETVLPQFVCKVLHYFPYLDCLAVISRSVAETNSFLSQVVPVNKTILLTKSQRISNPLRNSPLASKALQITPQSGLPADLLSTAAKF